MYNLNPKFVTDKNGKKISVILPIEEFEAIMEELEELEDVKLYDEAKKNKTDFIGAAQAFKEIEEKRKRGNV